MGYARTVWVVKSMGYEGFVKKPRLSCGHKRVSIFAYRER